MSINPRSQPSGPPPRSLGRRLEGHLKRLLLPAAARLLPPRQRVPGLTLTGARRILVVRQDNRLGNLVLLGPLLEALRAVAPRARIGLLVGERFADLFDGCPWIDKLWIEEKRALLRHPERILSFLRALRDARYEIALEASNPETHSFSNALFALASGAPWRVGFDHPRSRAALNWPVAPPDRPCHYAHAPLLLLAALGADPPVPTLKLAGHLGAPAGRGGAAGPILLHPGARGAKRWPTERVARLIACLPTAARERLLLIGGPAEDTLLTSLRAGAAHPVATRRLATLAELADLLRSARLYIGCDAGPMHLAAALGTPTVNLFCTSHPLRYAPLGARHITLVLGERSRLLADPRAHPPPASAPAAVERPEIDPAIADRLLAARPRLVVLPAGLSMEAEVAAVAAEVEVALARPAPRPAHDPA